MGRDTASLAAIATTKNKSKNPNSAEGY